MAYCHRLMNHPDEARRILDAVLSENARDWKALAERGRLAMAEDSPIEAEKWLRKAAAIAPHESDVNYSLCQCLRQQGKNKEAEEVLADLQRVDKDLERMADLSREIAQKPHEASLRYQAGLLLIRNGLESEGLRWFESALVEDPSHAETHQALADYYEHIGKKDEAEQHRRLAVPRAGENKKSGG